MGLAICGVLVGTSLNAPTAAAAPADPTPATPIGRSAPPAAELSDAVKRDLGLTWEQYLDRSHLAGEAAALDEQLRGTPGYQGVALAGDEIVIAGRGPAVTRAADSESVHATAPPRTAASNAETVERWYAQQVDADRTGLAGIGWNGGGWTVTVENADTAGRLADGGTGLTPRAFVESHPGLDLKQGPLASSHADILGGDGWGTLTRMPRCSIGFAAFGPDGRPAMLTAGHCTDNGSLTDARWENDPAVTLGQLAFAQFGSPNNTSNTLATPGADLAAYAGSPASLQPAVNSYPGAVRVTGTTSSVVGAPVCTSGRTTKRWHCSTIDSVGPYAVQGPGGASDIRWVQGFSTPMVTRPGDSGAGMLTGLRAVGVISAGGSYDGVEYSFGAGLAPAINRGYVLEIDIDAPRAEPAASGRLRGRVSAADPFPAGSVIRIETGGTVITAPVGADGSFEVAAPAGPANLQIMSGGSRSEAVAYDPRYGSAVGARHCGLREGGCLQRFTGGSVYWSSAGEHFVRGRIQQVWGDLGWENGWLGYPTSSESCGLVGAGCWQSFTGGRMYWSAATGAHPVRGAIGEAWNATGYERGTLGYPTSGEHCALRESGCFQFYERGSFYWSPATGAHWTRGAIHQEWGRRGSENGPLGYPVSGEICGLVAGGCFQRLQGGSLYWSAGSGAHPVIGAIGEYWGRHGWERGRFGFPVSGETCSPVSGTRTCTQRFSGGAITWSLTGGARG